MQNKKAASKLKVEIGNVEDYFELLAKVTDAQKFQFKAVMATLSEVKSSLGAVFDLIEKAKTLDQAIRTLEVHLCENDAFLQALQSKSAELSDSAKMTMSKHALRIAIGHENKKL